MLPLQADGASQIITLKIQTKVNFDIIFICKIDSRFEVLMSFMSPFSIKLIKAFSPNQIKLRPTPSHSLSLKKANSSPACLFPLILS